MVVTDAFVHEADIQRAALGLSTLEPVVIAHPLSTLSDQEIEARAAQAVTQIAGVLTIGSRS